MIGLTAPQEGRSDVQAGHLDPGAAHDTPPRGRALVSGTETAQPWTRRWLPGARRLSSAWTRGSATTLDRLSGGSLLGQGLAAARRGNHEAAFWLLREHVGEHTDDFDAVHAFFDAAVACGRPEAAAAALARVVRHEAASGDGERAAMTWIALETAAPDAPLDAITVIRLMPALKARLAGAVDADGREDARRWLRCALRRSTEAGSGLTAGMALKVFDEAAREDPDTARRAAAVALASPDLDETKRARVEERLAALDGCEPAPVPAEERPPEAGAGSTIDPLAASCELEPEREPALAITPATPLDLDGTSLVLEEQESGLRTRFDLRAVNAISVGFVGDLSIRPVAVMDLVTSERDGRRSAIRLRADGFDPATLLAEAAPSGDPLQAWLGELFARSGAAPLPDPDAALATRPRHHATLAAYDEDLRCRLAADEPAG